MAGMTQRRFLPAPLVPALRAAWTAVLLHAGAGLLVLVAVLAMLARYTWQLRCESFGCTFVGVIWVALAGLWAALLLAGLVLAAAQRRRGLGTQASAWALGLLVALGVGHLLYWQLH